MRKLVSREEKAKQRKRNQWIVGIVLVFLMIFSTLGFALQGSIDSGENSGTNINYNGFEFINSNGLWVLGSFVFQHNPNEVSDTEAVNLKPAQSYQGLPVYLYSEDDQAGVEIYVNMGQIATRVQAACPESEQCDENVPTKTCLDNFIIIREANMSSIRQEDNCVYIEGVQNQLTGLSDQFLFKILGVK